MTIEYILFLLRLVEQGVVSSVTVSQSMVTVRIKK